MKTPRWERLLPLAGIAYAALLVLAAVAFPMPQGDNIPARDPSWLAAHRTPVAIQSYLRAVAALAFVALAVAVARAIGRRLDEGSAAPRIALLGGALYGLMLLVAQAVGLGAEIASRDGAGAEALRALGSLQDGLLAMSSLPAIGLFAVAGAAFRTHRLVPQWLAWLTLAGVPLAALDAASLTGSPLEPVGVLGLVYFLVWSLAAGTTLLRRPAQPPQSGPVSHRVAEA